MSRNMGRVMFAVQESPEGGFEARAQDFSIFTQAVTLEKLEEMIRDAVSCHFGEDRQFALRHE